MNKFERESRQPADQQALPEAIAGDLSHMPAKVIDVSDAPSIAPPAPLTPDEVPEVFRPVLRGRADEELQQARDDQI